MAATPKHKPRFTLAGFADFSARLNKQVGLCHNCHAAIAAFDAAKLKHAYYSHRIHESSIPLEIMARRGCPLCQLFLAKVIAHNQRNPNTSLPMLGEPDAPCYFRNRSATQAESLSIAYSRYFASAEYSVHFKKQNGG